MHTGPARFFAYARRVETLYIKRLWGYDQPDGHPHEEIDGSILVALKRLDGRSGQVFSRLRTLKLRTHHLWLSGFDKAIIAFFTPRITRLELSHDMGSDSSQGMFDEEHMASAAINLREISFENGECSEGEYPYVCRYVEWARLLSVITFSTASLTYFSALNLSIEPHLLAYLSHQPHLVRLSIYYDDTVAFGLKRKSFLRLKSLHIRDSTLGAEFATVFLNQLALPEMVDCVVEIDRCHLGPQRIERLSEVIAAVVQRTYTTTLGLKLRLDEDHDETSIKQLVDLLEPLKQLRLLQYFDLVHNLPITFSEDNLVSFATSWPCIRFWTVKFWTWVGMNMMTAPHPHPISLPSLIQILSSCPDVIRLPVRLDCQDLLQDMTSMASYPTARFGHPFGPFLDVQISHTSNIEPLAQVLVSLLPEVSKIRAGWHMYDRRLQPTEYNQYESSIDTEKREKRKELYRQEEERAVAVERMMKDLRK
jgi:hypothetical protein